jgi:hypothetical protein
MMEEHLAQWDLFGGRLSFFSPRRSSRMSNLRTLLRGETSRTRLAALAPALGTLGGLTQGFLSLPRRDPHDADGIADHVGGALLAFGASRHRSSSFAEIARSGTPRLPRRINQQATNCALGEYDRSKRKED